MEKNDLKAVVIGGGIHGLTCSIALAKNNVDVTIIEKNEQLMQGTSGATQNRAHMGYHYPRSIETAMECLEGINFFKGKYPQALFYPSENYYLIEKNDSKTSLEGFKSFCDEMKIPYEMVTSLNGLWDENYIAGGFKVPEPVFDMKVLTKLLEKEASLLNINIRKNSEVIGFEEAGGIYRIIAQEKNNVHNYDADIILNATYAYSNSILKILGLEEDMTKYVLQKTEVPVVRIKDPIPALTIMDGDFVSLLPFAFSEDLVLLYDVIYSVIDKVEGYFLDDTAKYTTNFKKMIKHGEKYFPFMKELEHVESLYGTRPVPVEVTGDSRKTRIKAHQKHPGIFSILEGKFISAPLIAGKLITQIKNAGVIK